MPRTIKNRVDRVNAKPTVSSVKPGVSGRRFVLSALGGAIFLTAALVCAFATWRSNYERNLAIGEGVVVAKLDRLAMLQPPGVSKEDWNANIEQARTMLRAIVASNMFDAAALNALGARIESEIADAKAADAPARLSKIWDEIAGKAGPAVAKRHPKRLLLNSHILKSGNAVS